MPTEKPRLTIILDEKTLNKIEDFRFQNRFQNRSAAVLELIKLGLKEAENSKGGN